MTYLSTDKFKEIYTDEQFRNEVAYAIECLDTRRNFQYWVTMSYPHRYIVTEEQITEAWLEKESAKRITRTQNKGNLILIGMGFEYPERYPDDVCNYRVRGYFKNSKRNLYFIEFIEAVKGDTFFIPHANDETKARQLNNDHQRQDEYQNFKNLERLGSSLGIYSKSNLLKVINKYFNCNFRKVVIDNHNLNTDEVISLSPPLNKREKHSKGVNGLKCARSNK
jgi:hypothetical protein